jgi:hypothetical protein
MTIEYPERIQRMSSYIEKAEEVTLPVIPLRATVAFPSLTLNFEPGDDDAVQAAKAAPSSSVTAPTELMPEAHQAKHTAAVATRLTRAAITKLLFFIVVSPFDLCGGLLLRSF